MIIDKIFTLPYDERSKIVNNTAEKLNVSPAIIEKDLWVCILLKYLFNDFKYKDYIVFKGGTSLSKAYNVINRFSEDIDLTLNWTALGYPENEPYENRSNRKQDQYIQKINWDTSNFLKREVIPLLKRDLKGVLKGKKFRFYIEEKSPLNICFDYPKEYGEDSTILSIIKLEFSTLSEPIPAFKKEIKSYVSEFYPDTFSEKIYVKVVDSLRTFYDKVTILHREANRTNGNYPKRYSRHFYDLCKMIGSDLGDKSLKNFDLLEAVIEFKKKFYRSNFAKYDEIYQGKLKLVPPEEAIASYQEDYETMKGMIFGDIASFDEIIEVLKVHENALNKAIKSFEKWKNKQ
ncbi:Nucleotidyl transferase of uncharacterised function (DUF1814) [Mycoplasmopsis citelli]|uniref:Nucleotidyl transferase of uncharacterized function (DUF1814) n=1 Tax=Mycoplasmopsis citelli TaxID=171281 RepID=A0A449B195_9BACT|nr:nucleotidyl transferase AbiEii/AbiGii toxin family protein [Mycoplasmopsis citelli]VEU74368.1 Nucleotidyl transferase of uncharacterised function (DUF1814) [Mycoplasmopsis citelli]